MSKKKREICEFQIDLMRYFVNFCLKAGSEHGYEF